MHLILTADRIENGEVLKENQNITAFFNKGNHSLLTPSCDPSADSVLR